MPIHQLSLEALDRLDLGKIAEAFKVHLKRVAADCYDRPGEITPRDPSVHPDAVLRLSRQSRTILERLKGGRASNRELVGIALNYRARLSDLRAIGCEVVNEDHDHASGLSWYRLVSAPEGL